MSASPIENLLSRATSDIRARLEEAFQAGRDDMKRELAAMLGMPAPSGRVFQGTVDIAAVSSVTARAQSGTVKPAIKELIDDAPDGIRTAQIIERTGFKENSVRGTLSALKAEGVVERRGEFWFPVKAEGPLIIDGGPS